MHHTTFVHFGNGSPTCKDVTPPERHGSSDDKHRHKAPLGKMGKTVRGENTKRAEGMARKRDAAARKEAAAQAEREAAERLKWQQGAKDTSKR